MKELLEVTFHDGTGGRKSIQLDTTREAFAKLLGYASYEELLEVHGSWDQALDYWKSQWEGMGLEVKLNR